MRRSHTLPSGFFRRVVRALALATLVLTCVTGMDVAVAAAQSVTGMSGVFAENPQIENAAQAAEEAIKAVATEGDSWGGASGSIATLLTNTDTLFCAGWIITFRDHYHQLQQETILNPTLEQQRALQEMARLLDIVIAECDKILSDPPPEPPEDEARDEVDEAPDQRPCHEVCRDAYSWRDRTRYELALAQRRADEAARRTEWVEAIWADDSRTNEQKAVDSQGETPGMARRDETRAWNEMYDAEGVAERAQKRLEACLLACLEATKQTSLFGNNPLTYGLAGGVGLGIGVGVLGGSDDPPPSGGATFQPSEPSGGAGVASTTTGCGGAYRVFFNIGSDTGGHGPFVAMPASMTLQVTVASIHISGPAPFVDVDGDIDHNGSFHAAGMGTVAGFDDIMVEMTGTLTGCNAASGTLEGVYRMGINGGLPGGRPISYNINGTK